jgi:DNA-binding CsgD family transcriptional regulator
MTVRFSRHDRIILRMLIRGLSPNQVAAELEITESTANHHVRNVCKKAGVTGFHQLIIYVMQQPFCLRRNGTRRLSPPTNKGLRPPGYVDDSPYCRALAMGEEPHGMEATRGVS